MTPENRSSWAICCSDMLIKDEETNHLILGDTLGDGKTSDGFPVKKFHYMLAHPPFGVEWKDQQKIVTKEADELGFGGRFGAGLPAINDGSLVFLQHMISKMHASPDKGGRLEDRHHFVWKPNSLPLNRPFQGASRRSGENSLA